MVSLALAATPVRAEQVEIDLLRTYIGNRKGSAVLTGGREPENFVCSVLVTKGNRHEFYSRSLQILGELDCDILQGVRLRPADAR